MNAPVKTARHPLKRTPRRGSLADAVEYAYGEISDLAEEIRTVVDDASGTPRENTQRMQTLGETADALEGIGDAPDVPDEIECYVEWVINTRRGLSRSDRRDNATNALDAAISAIEDWISDQETDGGDEGGDGEEPEAVDVSDAETLRDDLENAKGELENVEFPGMRG